MIVSHRHRFIFVKTKKTAGTSLEIALSGICGSDDIITPITPPDEAERRRLGFPGPQNLRFPRRGSGPRAWLGSALPGSDRPRFRNHTPAGAIRRLLPQAWDGYFKFCFDRNPWDRTISLFHWMGGERRFGTIESFIRSGEEQPYSNYDRYSIDGIVAVDRVFRYEDMEQALAEISEHIGLPRPLSLPEHRAKGGSRTDTRHYRDVLTPEESELIAIVCAREIRLLGYAY